MRITRYFAVALLLAVPMAARAQQPDSASRARAKSDSAAAAARDSIELMKALGAAMADTTTRAAVPVGPQGGPSNPRLQPDISAIADLVGDLSPRASTQEDGTRLGVREVEVAISAAVDPYFRADFILGISDQEKISIEEAYATAVALPAELQARLGRFHMPFGKQQTTHRGELHTVEYPFVIQRLLSPDALKGTGVWASRIFAPFGFYQELQVTAVDRLGYRDETLTTADPINNELGGLGYSARLRNYVDFSEAANMELSFSALTGRVERAIVVPFVTAAGTVVNAGAARRTMLGADLTYRWRPLQEGLYRSLILQGEVMRQLNERDPAVPAAGAAFAAEGRDYTGAYLFGRYQLSRRLFLGARGDAVQDPLADGRTLRAGSGYLEWFPSEFSKLVAAYERVAPSGAASINRILLQATFAVGPHRPHPF